MSEIHSKLISWLYTTMYILCFQYFINLIKILNNEVLSHLKLFAAEVNANDILLYNFMIKNTLNKKACIGDLFVIFLSTKIV